MIFIDQYLNDDMVNVLGEIIDNHTSGNYKHVRDIILGYNSKKGIWISKYGESLVRKEIIKTEQPLYFSRPINDFSKIDSMVFYDDEIFETVRIHIDDFIKRILDAMFTVSKNVIDYRYITDIIVTEWNIKNTIPLYKNENEENGKILCINTDTCGEIHFRPIEVKENSWKEFRSITKYKGLMIRDTFKLAVLTFLQDRAEILK